MKKCFVNQALSSLSTIPKEVEPSKIDVLHCSQYNAYSYLHDSGCYGIVNNRQLMRMFRFALAAYVSDLWVGCSIVFLDNVHRNTAFIMGINGENIDIMVALLKTTEEVCKTMGFDAIQLCNNSKHTQITGVFNKNRLPDDCFKLEKGSLFRRF